MGKFGAAIGDAIANKALRNETKRNQMIADMEKTIDRRISVFESGTKIDPKMALLNKICNDEFPSMAAVEAAANNDLSRKNSMGKTA